MRTITEDNKPDIIAEYAEYVVEGLDWDALHVMAVENITNQLSCLTPDQITVCINTVYPDFLIEGVDYE